MLRDSARLEQNFGAEIAGSPAEIKVFARMSEAFVESTELLPQLVANQHERAGNCLDPFLLGGNRPFEWSSAQQPSHDRPPRALGSRSRLLAVPVGADDRAAYDSTAVFILGPQESSKRVAVKVRIGIDE